MRKIRSVLIIALTVIMLMSMSLFVACQQKEPTGDSSQTEQTYTLTFNTDGGNQIQSMSVKKDEAVSLPTPTKDGYMFDGWFTDAQKTNKLTSDSFVVKENTTLYANWVKGVTITLDPNGGVLDTTKVMVKEGAKISDSLSKIIPTYEHHQFDAWLDGENKLSSSKLATEDIKLVASYKVEVSVQIYAQKLDLSGYELVETKQVYAAANSQYEYKENLQGFKTATNADAVTKITVDADYAKNALKVYFDRNKFSISFNSNYPVEDVENEVKTESNVLYGATVDAVDTFTCDGYLLIGYATAPGGEVVYPVSGFKKNLYNAEPEDVAATKVTATKNLMLYGVWAKGYIDMFGGQDSIFFFEEEGKSELYLSRGGLFFKGVYTKDNRFEINDKDGKVLLHGKLLDNNTFCYRETNPEQSVKNLFVTGKGLDTSTTLIIEQYDDLTLTKTDKNGTEIERSKGYFRYDEESDDYIATFDEGTKNGESFHFMLGYDSSSGKGAFQIRDEKAVELGVINRYSVYGTSFAQLKYFQAIFNGYGQVAVNEGNQIASYYVVTDEATGAMVFMDSYGRTTGLYKLVEMEGKQAYVQYNHNFNRTVNVRPGEGATLTMDGTGNGTYTNGTTSVTGVYTVAESIMGDYIVTLVNNNTTMKFMTDTEMVMVDAYTDENGKLVEAHEESKAIVREIDENYAEYLYINDTAIYYHPLIAMNEPYNGKATIYLFDSATKTFAVGMIGSYTLDEKTGKYTFTVEEYKETGLNPTMLPVEFKNIKSFVFGLNSGIAEVGVNYWYAITDKNDVTTEYEVTYTCETDNSTIKVIGGGVAVYEYNSNTYVAQIGTDTKTNRTVLQTAQGLLLIVELNEETKTFTKYQYAPYNIYLIDEFGQANNNVYIALDGKGGAVLTYLTGKQDEEGNPIIEAEYPGTYAETEETTAFGSKISTFTANDTTSGKDLRLIVTVSNNRYYAFVERDTYLKEYRSENYGMLKLDGFGNMANYTTSDGKSYDGIYNVIEENQILFGVVYQNQIIYYYYIDIKGDTFTVKGFEYGIYSVIDNGSVEEIVIELDGYGKAKLFTNEQVTDEATGETSTERKYIDENATYEIGDDGKVTVTYKNGENQAKYIGKLGTLQNRYKIFIILHEEVVFTYVGDSDWTVMTIDDIGNAVIYDKLGVAETGSVTIINNNLLYYLNSRQTNASLYKYDAKNQTVEQIVYEERFGYYTKDLESLLFTEYGFAIFNNETRYFYEKTAETVYVYHQDATNADANEYGFVKQDFGTFGEEKTWEGETYYFNSGFKIVFNRKTESAFKYPVERQSVGALTFAPGGGDEFTVTGTILIGGNNENCYVTRQLDENGGYKMFITYKGYRLYVTINYTGDKFDGSGSNDNYFEVVAMTKEYDAKAALYTSSLDYLIALMFGGELPVNNVGKIYATTTYNEAGVVESNKVDAEFYQDSNLYDRNNNLITLKDYDFTWVNGSTIAVEYQATDGDTYKLYLGLANNQFTGELQYAVTAFTRLQTLTVGEYQAKLERVLYSEANVAAGRLFSFELFDKDGKKLEFEDGLYYGADEYTLLGFIRTYDDNKTCLTSTLYTITLKDKAPDGTVSPSEPTTPTEGEEGGTTTEKPTVIPALAVSTYESVEVTKEELKVYNKFEDETVWVEMNGKGEIVCLVPDVMLRKYVMPKNVSYDETTKVYTVTISEKVVYTVEIVQKEDGKDYVVVTKL